MVLVKSSWASTPITTNGVVTGPEWTGTSLTPIPAGYLLAKNDANFLYLAFDLVGDKGADPGVGDYFWFSVDVDGNHQITPMKDVNYGIYPYLPIKIGRQYCLGPGVWTTIIQQPSPAIAAHGFGSTPLSPIPHRVWELRLPFSEIGANLGNPWPTIRWGLRLSSTNPSFTYDYPYNFYNDFKNLHQILLAQGPSAIPAGAGPVIASVGLIPKSKIVNGYATTDPSYYLPLKNYVFGGTMHLLGNHNTMLSLWNQGARKYSVKHRESPSGIYAPVKESWSNYRWNGTTDVLEIFGPDSQDQYPLPNPNESYTIKDLLLQWPSANYNPGLHDFLALFYKPDGSNVPTFNSLQEEKTQTLTLMVDNNWPEAKILDIMHDNNSVPACAIETMTSNADGVKVKFKVWDNEGNLQGYDLLALWGTDQAQTITSDTYASHSSSVSWQGEIQKLSPLFVPPVTCAYQFRVRAWPKTTNGWSTFGAVEATKHVTIIVPGPPPMPMKLIETFPLGFSAPNKFSTRVVEPKKLGKDTI